MWGDALTSQKQEVVFKCLFLYFHNKQPSYLTEPLGTGTLAQTLMAALQNKAVMSSAAHLSITNPQLINISAAVSDMSEREFYFRPSPQIKIIPLWRALTYLPGIKLKKIMKCAIKVPQITSKYSKTPPKHPQTPPNKPKQPKTPRHWI